MGIRLTHFSTLARLGVAVLAAFAVIVSTCNYLVIRETRSALYSDISSVPYNSVGVLLGTSKYSRLGGENDHYRLRLDAAYRLFTAGKIDYILISGDNSTRYYDEPSTMRRDLIKLGIPLDRIYRDYAGFRTLDSVLRARYVFNLQHFTIISQASHNRRALYIALNRNIDAIAFNAGDGKDSDFNNKAREVMARVLAVMETHLLNTGPRFLGPIIEIGSSPPT